MRLIGSTQPRSACEQGRHGTAHVHHLGVVGHGVVQRLGGRVQGGLTLRPSAAPTVCRKRARCAASAKEPTGSAASTVRTVGIRPRHRNRPAPGRPAAHPGIRFGEWAWRQQISAAMKPSQNSHWRGFLVARAQVVQNRVDLVELLGRHRVRPVALGGLGRNVGSAVRGCCRWVHHPILTGRGMAAIVGPDSRDSLPLNTHTMLHYLNTLFPVRYTVMGLCAPLPGCSV
jgi:hypothetical protein